MRAVSGTTQVAGIIGWPVDASLSPAIHNAAFAAANLDWVYVAFPVAPGDAELAVAAMRALGIRGLNVTMPHKHAVMVGLDAIGAKAERVHAVNTIVAHDGHLVGTNTDGEGFVRFLELDANLPPDGVRALVLGAGGAARAVVAALGDAGAKLTISARRSDQAVGAAALAAGSRTVAWERDVLSMEAAGADLVVNATPLGRNGEELPIERSSLGDGQTVVDLVYHPKTTPLVRTAQEAGSRAFNGIGMLVHQAALSFEAWTGRAAPLEAMREAVS